MPDLGILAKDFGKDFALVVIMFFLLRQQDIRHKREMRREFMEREKMREGFIVSERAHHERARDLMVQVLQVIRDNSKAISTLVEMLRHE